MNPTQETQPPSAEPIESMIERVRPPAPAQVRSAATPAGPRAYALAEAARLDREAAGLWEAVEAASQEAAPYVQRLDEARSRWYLMGEKARQLRVLFPEEESRK